METAFQTDKPRISDSTSLNLLSSSKKKKKKAHFRETKQTGLKVSDDKHSYEVPFKNKTSL